MANTYLGPLLGSRIDQYANSAGQVYYHDTVAGTTSYAIPNGFQDGVGVLSPRLVDQSTGLNVVSLMVIPDKILGPSTRQIVGHNGAYGA
jgi:hypothetical protein